MQNVNRPHPIGAKALAPTKKREPPKPPVTSDEGHIHNHLLNLENAVLAAIKEHKRSNNVIGMVGDNNAGRILGQHDQLNAFAGHDNTNTTAGSVNLLYDDDDGDEEQAEGVVAMAAEKIRVGVAADSGATDNVIGLDDLPAGVVPEGPPGPPFSNASGGDIKKYGYVTTMMGNSDGKVGCGWTACAVTRPLHSVSRVCGPQEGPGVQDFMFNNRIGVVMPPGLVDLLLKHIKPVARYPRRGGLYVGDFEMSSFTRPGPAR
jgi:hypothetical protein